MKVGNYCRISGGASYKPHKVDDGPGLHELELGLFPFSFKIATCSKIKRLNLHTQIYIHAKKVN